jgi:hypothetical protein
VQSPSGIIKMEGSVYAFYGSYLAKVWYFNDFNLTVPFRVSFTTKNWNIDESRNKTDFDMIKLNIAVA